MTEHKTIESAYDQIQQEIDARNQEQKRLISKIETKLKQRFEYHFKDMIPLLKGSGIEWDVYVNGIAYADEKGIEFKKQDRSIKMRWSFSCTNTNGKDGWVLGNDIAFRQWDHDKFIEWVHNYLLT